MRQLWTLLLLLSLGAAPAVAAELDGFWKIDGQPVWVEIRTGGESPGGTVRRNDNNPDAVGFALLKGLATVAGTTQAWVGQVFAARLGEYRNAEITLAEPQRLEITVNAGFMSRTIGWTKVDAVP